MTDAIRDDQIFVPVEGLEVNEVPDGRVVYQASRERVHYLNPTALVVFELCSEKLPLDAIAAFLKDAYQLGPPPLDEVKASAASLLKEELARPWTP